MANWDVTPVNVAYPEAGDLHLRIAVGACRLKITPGEGGEWVNGSYHYPSGVLPPKVEQEGGTIRITQEHSLAGVGGLLSGAPRFELALGRARPYMLTVEVGASESNFDLGGLPITRLIVKQGAGRVGFDFSAPNPQGMSLFDLDCGAVGMELKNLGNANFAEMALDGGAASFQVDFGGTLQREAHVRITAGLSSVEVRVPSTTAAKITAESVLGGVDLGDGFTKKEGAFLTEAALVGKTPVLTVRANVTLGSLAIRST
jgi:hypothetical protein